MTKGQHICMVGNQNNQQYNQECGCYDDARRQNNYKMQKPQEEQIKNAIIIKGQQMMHKLGDFLRGQQEDQMCLLALAHQLGNVWGEETCISFTMEPRSYWYQKLCSNGYQWQYMYKDQTCVKYLGQLCGTLEKEIRFQHLC